MEIHHFFDQNTFTLTYVVSDSQTSDAVIIDPVLDFDPASGKVAFDSLEKIEDFVGTNKLRVGMILETHAHADHLSSSQYLKEKFPEAQLAIGANIRVVQETFKKIFNLGSEFAIDGSQFDRLLEDGEEVKCGSLEFRVINTPGHTPACCSYVFGDAVFTGDALFMPDFGTGRCDFPAGCAEDLYTSVHEKLYRLPDATRVYVGHDYMPGGRELAFQSTIGEEKSSNIQLSAASTRDQFVAMRQKRDATLSAPKLLLPSVQVNIDAGHLPKAEENGTSYLKIPLRLASR